MLEEEVVVSQQPSSGSVTVLIRDPAGLTLEEGYNARLATMRPIRPRPMMPSVRL